MADRRSKPEIQLVSSDDEVRERMLSYVWSTVHLIRVAVFTDLLYKLPCSTSKRCGIFDTGQLVSIEFVLFINTE